MSQNFKSTQHLIISPFLLSLAFLLVMFYWQGNKGLSLWDEGYLWYGAQRVTEGEIPKLDFKAYDPGRYYWIAGFMKISGNNGIMTLRAAVAVFQFAGLFLAIFLIARSQHKFSFIFLLLSVLILLEWMLPRHKLFDISLSIFLLGILTFLIEKPSSLLFFLAGSAIGLIAVFGRNHGLYGMLALVGIVFWLYYCKRIELNPVRSVFFLSSGVILGYLPVLLMLLLIPGFAPEFWSGLKHQVGGGGTNLALPIPWPWTVNYSALSIDQSIRKFLIGFFFIAILAFSVLGTFWLLTKKKKTSAIPATVVAAIFLTLPYAHHAFSRADVSHLAQSIFPMLLGCMIILANAQTKVKWPLTLSLVIASIWVMHIIQPGWQCRAASQCVEIEVSGNELKVKPETADDISLLRRLAKKFAPNGESFIVTPFWPGAYALLERRSPMWDIYALFPRNEDFEKKEIERLKSFKPAFALILNFNLRGAVDRRFSSTHPLTYQYILDNFEPVSLSQKPIYKIFKVKSQTQ